MSDMGSFSNDQKRKRLKVWLNPSREAFNPPVTLGQQVCVGIHSVLDFEKAVNALALLSPGKRHNKTIERRPVGT